jgi:uncharacterized protein involved in exopolysaccharide biosynthesis
MDKNIEVKDIKHLIKRRKKEFLSIFALIFLAGLIVAVALPPIYKSEAIIRVEQQEIPEDFVQSAISDFVGERLARISQQVLNRDKLLTITKKYNLYSDTKVKKSDNEKVSQMKKDIVLLPMVPEIQVQRKNKNASAVNLSFSLSYQGRHPNTVQQVTETLSNFFLEEDLKRRERVVSATNEFLKAELKRLKEEINLHEKKISQFKYAHQRELPNEKGYNFQAILRLERDLDKAENRFRLLNEKEMLLNAQLTRVEPLTPIIVEGDNVATNPNQRLKSLYLQLTQLRSIYSEKHPDIKKIKSEIKELETQVKSSDVSVEKIKRLEQLEDQLAEMQGSHGPNHPDIKAINKEISVLKPEVNRLMTEAVKIKISEERPDNPAYINIVTQINAIKMEKEAIQADKKQIALEIAEFQRRIEKAPFVEKELNELARDLESTQKKYLELSNKLAQARIAEEMEGKQQAQRVSLASAAYLPTDPFKPNRLLIILLGFVSAFVLSSFFVALREGMDDTIKTTDQIKNVTGIPVLSTISFIVTSDEKRSRRFKKFFTVLALILVIGALVVIVDQFIISFDNLAVKFDDFWMIILERIKMIA